MKTYNIEMTQGQSPRYVDAEEYAEREGWLVFYRKPAMGGTSEYWRVRLEYVVSIETKMTSA